MTIETATVTQADRDNAADFMRMIGHLTKLDADNVRTGEWDATKDVQWFARKRIEASHELDATMAAATELAQHVVEFIEEGRLLSGDALNNLNEKARAILTRTGEQQ